MLRDEENYVALFIDWDNLAISTAADFGGATPTFVPSFKVAQRYGTILLARAYAEWQVPSDRLAVYRAGVDPIYAPTFRFEPDPVGGPARGKSLADPCLVADCIDMLHLMPAVTHFVLVSGDKDLIPIVRLVQLRGRKVVVIGPDYVAAILRDMADEYISYRSLVESGETHSTAEQVQAGSAGPRRRGGRPVSTARAVPGLESRRVVVLRDHPRRRPPAGSALPRRPADSGPAPPPAAATRLATASLVPVPPARRRARVFAPGASRGRGGRRRDRGPSGAESAEETSRGRGRRRRGVATASSRRAEGALGDDRPDPPRARGPGEASSPRDEPQGPPNGPGQRLQRATLRLPQVPRPARHRREGRHDRGEPIRPGSLGDSSSPPRGVPASCRP